LTAESVEYHAHSDAPSDVQIPEAPAARQGWGDGWKKD
jgi:ABC-2 type transport system ATP-binding protein